MNSVCPNRRRVLSTEYNLLGMCCGGVRGTSEKKRCRYGWEGVDVHRRGQERCKCRFTYGYKSGTGTFIDGTCCGSEGVRE